jgi:hypothetical protein
MAPFSLGLDRIDVQGKPPGQRTQEAPEKGGKLRGIEGWTGVNHPKGRFLKYKILYVVCQVKKTQYIVILRDVAAGMLIDGNWRG